MDGADGCDTACGTMCDSSSYQAANCQEIWEEKAEYLCNQCDDVIRDQCDSDCMRFGQCFAYVPYTIGGDGEEAAYREHVIGCLISNGLFSNPTGLFQDLERFITSAIAGVVDLIGCGLRWISGGPACDWETATASFASFCDGPCEDCLIAGDLAKCAPGACVSSRGCFEECRSKFYFGESLSTCTPTFSEGATNRAVTGSDTSVTSLVPPHAAETAAAPAEPNVNRPVRTSAGPALS